MNVLIGWTLTVGFLTQGIGCIDLSEVFETAPTSLFQKQEEVPYNLINKSPKYEKRQYDALNWVCGTEVPTELATQHEPETFKKILGYLQRENTEGLEMSMSKPVAIWYNGGVGQPNAKLKTCFYIQGNLQTNPPVPTNSALTIFKSPPMTVYTRKVDGHFKRRLQWLREAKTLLDILKADGIKVKLGNMVWAAYDPPFQIHKRKNEVWFIAL